MKRRSRLSQAAQQKIAEAVYKDRMWMGLTREQATADVAAGKWDHHPLAQEIQKKPWAAVEPLRR